MPSSRRSRPDRPAMTSRAHPGRWLSLVAVLLLAVTAGCSGTESAAASPSASVVDPTISGAWVRPPIGPDRPAAGYLTIVGHPDVGDALVAAESAVAASVEIHQTMTDASGVSAMHPVDRIEIPAGATVVLEPGGYHLMLMGVTGALEPGATVELILTFETAGTVTVQAEIRAG